MFLNCVDNPHEKSQVCDQKAMQIKAKAITAVHVAAHALLPNPVRCLRRLPLTFLAVVSLTMVTGCISKSDNERYVASRPDLDPHTREAILQHRVILGMYPDEAAAAAGQFAYAVKADEARWGDNFDAEQVIYSERAHPDNSEIEMNFWTRTQFDTTNLVGFKVVFTNGRAASITRLPKWKDTQ